MKAKRIIALLICFVMIFSLASCVKDAGEGTPNVTDGSDIPEDTDAPVTDAPATDIPDTNAPETEAPVDETSAQIKEESDLKKSLKVLAIGNSFSTDGMEYLYQIAKNAGVEEIVLGNLYYGGCSLDQHYGFMTKDSAEYTYYKNTTGSWSSVKNFKMSAAIVDEEWDFITLQQTSKTSGLASSYGRALTKLIEYVEEKAPNATLVWHATWAYQQDSTHSSFPNYDKSQQKMYDMIIDCVEECILTNDSFKTVIPCTTSIQNARTSFIGDKLTRDGYHLDYNIGRYIAGLTWYAALTGDSIDDITYNPSSKAISEDMMKVAKESVNNAIKKPLEITQSEFTSGEGADAGTEVDPSIVLSPADFREADTALAAENGVDLSGYTLLEWSYLENTYWHCTNKAGTTTPGSSAGTYKQNVCSERKYSIDELPAGTVFIADDGWQYRIDIFPSENAKYTGSRPGMITARFFKLTESFLNGCTYMGWNISSNPKSDISAIYAQAACHLRIYVPNAQ